MASLGCSNEIFFAPHVPSPMRGGIRTLIIVCLLFAIVHERVCVALLNKNSTFVILQNMEFNFSATCVPERKDCNGLPSPLVETCGICRQSSEMLGGRCDDCNLLICARHFFRPMVDRSAVRCIRCEKLRNKVLVSSRDENDFI